MYQRKEENETMHWTKTRSPLEIQSKGRDAYPRRWSLLLGLAIAVLSATTLSNGNTAVAQAPAPKLCTAEVCITGTIYAKDPTTIEFGVHALIDGVGWLGLGMGGDPSSMARNDLAICWPKSTGGASISQRSAPMNTLPSPRAIAPEAIPFKIQTAKTGLAQTAAKEFSCTFSRPLNLATSPILSTDSTVNVIFAIGTSAVREDGSGDPQKAQFSKHFYTGKGALTIGRKAGSSAEDVGGNPPLTTGPLPGGGSGSGSGSGGAGGSGKSAEQARYDTLVKAHGIMMTLAFLFIFPTGAFLVRFFCDNEKIFKLHRPIQGIGFLTALASFICIIVAVSSLPTPRSHFSSSTHALLGLIIIVAIVAQVGMGIYIYKTFNPETYNHDNPNIPTWLHRGWGYSVLITGAAQVYLGMKQYGAWPTGKEGVWYGYAVWVGIMAVVFVFGSVVKRMRGNRRRRNESLSRSRHDRKEDTGSRSGGGYVTPSNNNNNNNNNISSYDYSKNVYENTYNNNKQSNSRRRHDQQEDEYELQGHQQSFGGHEQHSRQTSHGSSERDTDYYRR